MKEKYIRDANGTRLQIQLDSLSDSYMRKMIERQAIPGLLPMTTVRNEEFWEVSFAITGMQTLEKTLRMKSLSAKRFKQMIASIDAIYSACARYLLSPEHLLLDAKYIYCSNIGNDISFIYLPEYNGDPETQIKSLCELWIRHLDHTDEYAVDAAYDLLENSKQDGFSIRAWYKSYSWDKESQVQQVSGPDFSEYREPDVPIIQIEDMNSSVSKSQKEKKRFRLFHKKQKTEKTEEEPVAITEQVVWNKPHHTETTYLTNIGIEEDENFSPQQLRILFPVTGGSEIALNQEYLLVGKSDEYADIIIDDITVSRIHAEIFEQEDGIFVEDCNSKNGTQIDGRMLEPGERVRLMPGTYIKFGRVEYLFR